MNSTVLWVTAGRGPVECEEATAAVSREIVREAESVGLSVSSSLPPKAESASSVAISLSGEGHEVFAMSWTGTILWIARSPRRGKASRKNWYVGVFLGERPVETACLDERNVRFETMRAGGPGGQHQNVTDSAVRAVHLPSGITAIARDQRSQQQNRKAALRRLEEILSMQAEEAQDLVARREWQARISVNRGNPRRIYFNGEIRSGWR